jgi:hypothetical protein
MLDGVVNKVKTLFISWLGEGRDRGKLDLL